MFCCLRLKYLPLLGFIAASMSSSVVAGENLSAAFSACMDKAGGVTVAMIECMDAETKQQDARLNQAYQALMGNLNSERQNQLRQAQRLWIKYRDANCKFYFDPDGGSLARVSAVDCVMTLTASRAKELEDLNAPN